MQKDECDGIALYYALYAYGFTVCRECIGVGVLFLFISAMVFGDTCDWMSEDKSLRSFSAH